MYPRTCMTMPVSTTAPVRTDSPIAPATRNRAAEALRRPRAGSTQVHESERQDDQRDEHDGVRVVEREFTARHPTRIGQPRQRHRARQHVAPPAEDAKTQERHLKEQPWPGEKEGEVRTPPPEQALGNLQLALRATFDLV